MPKDNETTPVTETLTADEKEAQLIKLEEELDSFKSQLDKKSIEIQAKEKELLEKEAKQYISKETETDTQDNKTEEMRHQIASLTAQKDHFRTKYISTKERLEEVEGRQPVEILPGGDKQNVQNPVPETGTERLERIEFMTTHRELGRDEIGAVIAIAKGKGITYEAALESDLGKITIEAIQSKKQKENAIPGPSDRSQFEEKYDTTKMSEEELKSSFPKIVSEAIRAGKNARRNEAF